MKLGESQLFIRGGWAFERFADQTRAERLNSHERIVLEGELHLSLWEEGGLLSAVGGLVPEIVELSCAHKKPDEEPTVGALLRGSEWGLLFIELTGRCNERCVHCYASSSPEVSQELSFEQILGVIDEAATLGFKAIQFTGGDPLLSPHLLAAIEHARAAGVPQIEVYTNGLAFKRELAARFAELQVSMALSVYSHRPEVHDSITRTPGSLVRTLRAIDWALEAGVPVRVGVVLREENAEDTQAIISLLSSKGVPAERVGVDRERPVGRGAWDDRTEDAYAAVAYSVHSSTDTVVGAGKLAVTYDGHLVPCIFERSQILGTVSTGVSMRSLLDQPFVIGSTTSRAAALPVVGQALACTDCQMRRLWLHRRQATPNAEWGAGQ